MTANPDVRKLTFTGSTEVGRILMRQSAETIKKLSLELGGNAPFIVFDDADLDAAVSGAIASKYRNAGQTCVCVNRLYVQAGIYDAFAAKLVEAVKTLKVGNGLEPGVLQGPLIDQAAVDKVEEHIRDAVSKGARILTGGKRHALGQTFFEPTVLANVSSDAKVAQEETFGPLAPLFRFETDEEALRLANDTEFGLASYFYSRDVGRVWKVAEGLESGMVGINTGMIYRGRSIRRRKTVWPGARRFKPWNRRICGGKISLFRGTGNAKTLSRHESEVTYQTLTDQMGIFVMNGVRLRAGERLFYEAICSDSF